MPSFGLGFLLAGLAVFLLAPRTASAASFAASLDRAAVAPGEPFVYQVTLTVADETVEDFQPPNFGGLQVLAAPRGPSRSTQVQMGGGQTMIQNGYTWRYELVLPAGAKSGLTIGAARAKVNGRVVSSNPVQVKIGAGSPGRAPSARGAPGGGGLFPRGLFGGGDLLEDEEPRASSAGAAFIKVSADKPRAFVGEQVTVGWYLYVTDMPNNFQPTVQPRTDGFWTEEIPSTHPQGRLTFNTLTEGGQTYQVALLMKKALFPLAPGKLTVTPMEAEIAKVDFFGRPIRTAKLKADPVTIEAVPLPKPGQPADFPAGNVGRLRLEASVDRAAVAVGDAVTLTIAARGQGNLRNVRMPSLPGLEGWKSYEPKIDVQVEAGDTFTGAKTVEWLLRPERPGKTTIPPFELVFFEPAARRYETARTQPIEIVVTGDGVPEGSAAPVATAFTAHGTENVLGAAIRPIRIKDAPARETGTTFLHGRGLVTTVVVPPIAFLAFVIGGRVRERLRADDPRSRRRRLRSLARRRLRAAEEHRAAGRAGPFYGEIDRVLREVLSERLGAPVAGMRHDELGALLGARGLSGPDAGRVVAALAACDEARFAPSAARVAPEALGAALTEAGEILDLVERALDGGKA